MREESKFMAITIDIKKHKRVFIDPFRGNIINDQKLSKNGTENKTTPKVDLAESGSNPTTKREGREYEEKEVA
jgi:hypothetical protein